MQVNSFLEKVYQPKDEKKVIDYVNDGLNRALRKHAPPRERPPDEEAPRYENYWHARYMMDLINDGIGAVESSNGGKVKPSKVFKRLDMDGDGHISLSDLREACERYKVPANTADLHALLSALDKKDSGSVSIGEFCRNFEVFSGSLLDAMERPIKEVVYEGGIVHGGPLQDKLDKQQKEIECESQSEARNRCLLAQSLLWVHLEHSPVHLRQEVDVLELGLN